MQSPCKLILTSLYGQLLCHLNQLYPENASWRLKTHSQSYTELFKDKENITYLTADSENVITDILPNHTYIIGGIVDHNQYPVKD